MNEKKRKNKIERPELVVFFSVLAVITIISLLTLPRDSAEKNKNRAEQVQTVSESPAAAVNSDYESVQKTEAEMSEGMLVLVNNSYEFDDTSVKDDLVSVYENQLQHEEQVDAYYVADSNVVVRTETLDSLSSMLLAFYNDTGINSVNAVSGFRSYNDQKTLYTESLAENGDEYTKSYMTDPGHSEHHTGLAMDFSLYYEDTGESGDFDGTGDFQWFSDNSWKYGYIRRYDESKSAITGISFEPWHFRYVGLPHAYYIKENGLCFEEYIDYLRQFEYDGEHLKIDCEGGSYEVYFCDKDNVFVPVEGEYTISGNNVDGFIITMKL